jgi:hypothetical protein
VVADLLKQQQDTCDELRARLQQQLAALPTDKVMDRLVVQFRIEQMTAILAWLETCETTLLAKDPA